MGFLEKLTAAWSELSFVGKVGLVLILLAAVLGVVYVLLPGPRPAATEAEARAKLQEVLDSWLAQTSPKEFPTKHPRVALKDEFAFRVRLLRYAIGPQKSEERGVHTFPVTLTFQQKEDLARSSGSLVGLLGAPLGQGPLLASPALFRPQMVVGEVTVSRDYLILRARASDGGERWEIVGQRR